MVQYAASASATTVRYKNDTELLDGVIGVLDAHEFMFARSMWLADALGCVSRYSHSTFITIPRSDLFVSNVRSASSARDAPYAVASKGCFFKNGTACECSLEYCM